MPDPAVLPPSRCCNALVYIANHDKIGILLFILSSISAYFSGYKPYFHQYFSLSMALGKEKRRFKKQDMQFRRYVSKGTPNVFAESILLAMAGNINKLHNKIQKGRAGTHLFPVKSCRYFQTYSIYFRFLNALSSTS